MGDKSRYKGKSNRRIALLTAQADETYQTEFIRGVMKTAFSYGYDVCVFSMFIKYQNNKDREKGESNIYNLINYDMFDAVIIHSDIIQTPGIVEEIEEKVHKVFDGPVVCVDKDSKYFYSFWTDGYPAVYATISHFIEVHGYKDIAYLTGRRNHIHSRMRLEAYKDAMKDHGLPVRADRIYYGDFWYYSGSSCAEDILRSGDIPEAIGCANDPMAIGFAVNMTKHGKSIPHDIAIAGYGTSEEGQSSPKSLTSTYIPGEYYGSFAVKALIRQMNGEKLTPPDPDASLYIGESCGCEVKYSMERKARETWITKDSEESFESVHNYMMENMLLANNLDEFFRTVYDSIFYIHDLKKMEICLDPNWMKADTLTGNPFYIKGYPEIMVNVLSYDADNPSLCMIDSKRLFRTSDLLPYSNDESCKGCFFLPLFYENKSYGYVMLSFGTEPRAYESVARLWLYAVSRGLEAFRRQMLIKLYSEKLEQIAANKYDTNETKFYRDKNSSLSEDEQNELAEVEKILDGNLLKYHFQPIVNAYNGDIFSYEALMRSNSGVPIPPLSIIKYADMMGRLNDIETATFKNVLKIVGERDDIFDTRKVFINSIPGCKLSASEKEYIKEQLFLKAGTVVVELTEEAELSDEDLDRIKTNYRSMGIDLAVDDYGTGYSNVSNLLRYMPEYVKIDRSLLTEIQNSDQKQHFVREIIDFCHANNIKALAEGVETRDELATVIRLGADLIQGYYIARPTENIITSIDANVRMEINRFHKEREAGTTDEVFIAGKSSRISLNSILKDNKKTIIIGDSGSTFRDITITGTPNHDTGIHLEILEGYDGHITLENVCLSNVKNRPCITIADNARVLIHLEGENHFKGNGIKVPKSSSLTVEGDGNLRITVSGSDGYGIGNTKKEAHGTLDFYQDGEIYIEANGQNMSGIGSGLGGIIRINKGKYIIRVSGEKGVAIGSFDSYHPLKIHDCDILINNNVYEGVCIGSFDDNSEVEIWRSLVRCEGGGGRTAVIGSLTGSKASVTMHDMSFHVSVQSDYSTAVGSLYGATDFTVESAAITYIGHGMNAYVYGGNTNTKVRIVNTDVNIEMDNSMNLITLAPDENIEVVNGRNKTIFIEK